ncbi:conserved hypothetical protein [Flavobacterium sp. 9AF]|uniref:hypothetical protein n=1 Tax=Flavobacterium sp. 9AF TaxID=2653142 RepID=UPI0012F3F284|nr:hypothetical protein [Flavobacterium sp. 9AF]VXB45981.1 conserved hypothetical protein [Flavobacterium sp. 9AF]
MENQKDIEVLRESLNLKMEKFNRIRFGYEDMAKVSEIVEIEEEIVLTQPDVFSFDSIANDIEEEKELVEVGGDFYSQDTNEKKSEFKPAMNLTNLGTSYFGRRRR